MPSSRTPALLLLLIALRADAERTCTHEDVVPGWRITELRCTTLNLGLGLMYMMVDGEDGGRKEEQKFMPAVHISDDEMWGFAQSLSKNRHLVELNFPRVKVSPRGMAALGHALESNADLDSITFNDAGLTPEHMTKFAERLGVNTGVRRFSAWHDLVGDGGAVALADMLKVNGHLRELELHNASITAKGASALAQSLKHNRGLAVLLLDVNPYIGDEGVSAIAEVLAGNKLAGLSLVNIGITGAGVAVLAEALGRNSALRKLDLRRNGLNNEDISPMIEMLRMSTVSGLTEINLAGNQNISTVVQEEIKQLLTRTLGTWYLSGQPGHNADEKPTQAYARWVLERDSEIKDQVVPAEEPQLHSKVALADKTAQVEVSVSEENALDKFAAVKDAAPIRGDALKKEEL